MADNRVSLARVIVTKTGNGELAWSQTDADDVQVRVAGGVVVLAQEYDQNGDNAVMTIRVYNKSGALVETFNDRHLSGLDSAPWYSLLANTYDAARRNALGADKLIDEIIEELTKSDVPF